MLPFNNYLLQLISSKMRKMALGLNENRWFPNKTYKTVDLEDSNINKCIYHKPYVYRT